MQTLLYRLIIILIFSHTLYAQEMTSKVALVIGNASYQDYTPLNNAVSDAHLMKVTLEKMEFSVIYLENATNSTLKKALKTFQKKVKSNSIGLFYYAGHGIEINGQNYLLGIDTLLPENLSIRKDEVKQHSLALKEVVSSMQESKNPINIIILDACRKDPDQDVRDYQRQGLAPYVQTDDLFIAYATQAGTVASDGEKGGHGLFTEALVQQMHTPGLDIEGVFKKTREVVYKKSLTTQRPTTYSSILGSFYFTPLQTRGLKRNANAQPQQTFLKRHKRFIEPAMVLIEPKQYLMGDASTLATSPVHSVNLVKPFYIAKHELTFSEYDLFAKATGHKKPSDHNWGRSMQPVINVSWRDAVAYCKWLSKKSGKHYRLSSESEWEYVARSNTQTKYGIGDNDILLANYAWFKDTANEHAHEVGTKTANVYGVYDMLGNVQEWVQDDYVSYTKSDYRVKSKNGEAVVMKASFEKVIRGGTWFSEYDEIMVYSRENVALDERNSYTGFRIVQDIK